MRTTAAICTNMVTVTRDSKSALTLRIVLSDSGDPLDLTSFTSIEARFVKEDGTMLSKTASGGGISVLSAVGGKIKVTLDEADTALLRLGEKQDFEVKAVLPTGTRICQFKKQLNVRPRITN